MKCANETVTIELKNGEFDPLILQRLKIHPLQYM